MSASSRIASYFAQQSKTNFFRSSWDRLETIPLGKRAFSRLVGWMAPYTGTIHAEVLELREGRCRTLLRDRRAVRNHLESVHAIALANLGELTGNAALAYSLPDDARFIVAGMSVDYVKKARGDIYGVCEQAMPSTSERREYDVHVSLRNAADEEVAKVTLRTLVGPKRA